MLAGVIDPDYQGKFGLALPHGAEEGCIRNAGDPLGSLSITLWLWLMENYNNPMHAGLLMALRLQQWRFGSSYQNDQNHDHLGARWRQREHRMNGWSSDNQVTRDRNEDWQCHECLFLILFWVCLSLSLSLCLPAAATSNAYLFTSFSFLWFPIINIRCIAFMSVFKHY